MHWFDDTAKKVAEAPEARATRRGVLRGAAIGAVAAPLASQLLEYVGVSMEAYAQTNDCNQCYASAGSHLSQGYADCARYGYEVALDMATAAKKKKKKKKKKPPPPPETPIEVVKQFDCAANVVARWNAEIANCDSQYCYINVGFPPAPGGGCASGTSACGSDVCCYGDDLCCGCIHPSAFNICCVRSVGCDCCPQS